MAGYNNRKPYRREERQLDRARAPYNFVPLNTRVVLPDTEDGSIANFRASYDVPFRDAISGFIDIELRSATPLFIRDSDDDTSFFQIRDIGGKKIYAIPGTSLRGMLRTVVEIASFGKMHFVNDHTYGIRDLHNRDLYGKHMAEISPRKRRPVPLVSAGWLVIDKDKFYDEDDSPRWYIEPCNFAQIEYGLIQEFAARQGNPHLNLGRKQSSPEKYKRWGEKTPRTIRFDVEISRQHNEQIKQNPPSIGSFGKVKKLYTDRRGQYEGTLVFTGQPSEYNPAKLRNKRPGAGNPKHHDFVFYGSVPNIPRIEIDYKTKQAFEFVHSSSGEQHSMDLDPNEEWNYWKKKLEEKKNPQKVPIFFLQQPRRINEPPKIRAFGLAMMFRLAYQYSTKEAITRQQPKSQLERPDLAELLFGRVEKENNSGHFSHKGRVSIETALADGHCKELKEIKTVLGGPKASYYPNYIEQSTEMYGASPTKGPKGKAIYKTYMNKEVRVRGWKRYPIRKRVAPPPPLPKRRDGSVNEKVATRFKPLSSGCQFTTRIHVHNLRPFELGALLWSLDFGGRKDCYHGLGMAKNLGYGAVQITIKGHQLRKIDRRTISAQELDDIRQAYIDYMTEQIPNWQETPQIKELIAMAIPTDDPEAQDLRHMSLSHPNYRNEFQAAKKAGLALPAHYASQHATSTLRQLWKEDILELKAEGHDVDKRSTAEKNVNDNMFLSDTPPKKTASKSSAPKRPPKAETAPKFQQVQSSTENSDKSLFDKYWNEILTLTKDKKVGLVRTWIADKNASPEDLKARIQVVQKIWDKKARKKWKKKDKNLDILEWLDKNS